MVEANPVSIEEEVKEVVAELELSGDTQFE